MVTGGNGIVSFVKPGLAYRVQVLEVPEGYSFDPSEETVLKAAGGVTPFVIAKN